MGRKCCVPYCNTGYAGCKEKLSLFQVPSPDKNLKMFEEWCKVVPRSDRTLTRRDHVCEKHFQTDCIIRVWEFRGIKVCIVVLKIGISVKFLLIISDKSKLVKLLQKY